MSAQEILAEISKLSPEERQEVRDGMDKRLTDGLAGFKRSGATSLAELAKAQGVQPENIWDVLARYAGTFDGLPEDMAMNHDHYLYGTPKRKP